MAIIWGIEAGKFTQEEKIFRDLIYCQDDITAKIEIQYSTDSNNPMYWNWPIAVPESFNHKLYKENTLKNLEISETAYQPCDDMLIEKYQISTWKLKEIRNKWIQEDWIKKLDL